MIISHSERNENSLLVIRVEHHLKFELYHYYLISAIQNSIRVLLGILKHHYCCGKEFIFNRYFYRDSFLATVIYINTELYRKDIKLYIHKSMDVFFNQFANFDRGLNKPLLELGYGEVSRLKRL